MKAVLEFSYPEDEHKLLYALRGHDMFVALVNIRLQLNNCRGDEVTLRNVKEIVDNILKELGDV
jgi:hypothetical protein